ncbi:hypothetical protein KFL_000050410 [Klebsormidium nitens]|uniref:Uncharacterized protein n=1 Tax=Klebsormidium nitens TaxID=105231 RepID=A0A1Y1HHG2_KLENI|nr:hypothetical protein KFL_000050410 [Klebsormidium nitens]|eukprot:GAQ77904.1 hypothetical protein KFL_000050410 [Klebsormidium nitens]
MDVAPHGLIPAELPLAQTLSRQALPVTLAAFWMMSAVLCRHVKRRYRFSYSPVAKVVPAAAHTPTPAFPVQDCPGQSPSATVVEQGVAPEAKTSVI